MTVSKFLPGEPVESLEELMMQEYVIFNGKKYHSSWFSSWQLRYADYQIRLRRVFKVKYENIE